MKAIKRFLAALMIAVMLMGVNAPAMAVTKPGIFLKSQSAAYVKRGNTIKFYYRLKSGSYTRKSGTFRAVYKYEIRYNATNGRVVKSTVARLYTGTVNGSTAFKPKANLKTGMYYWVGRVYYNATGANKLKNVRLSVWKCADRDYTCFKVIK